MKTTFQILFVAGLWMGQLAHAQLVDEFNPPPANCCLTMTAHSLAEQLQDWNQLGRYHKANEELKARPVEQGRVVFMGDSITDLWKLEEYFPGKPYINRGIGGQTTPQMLVRMYPDVIDLRPAAMVLLAGTNDVAHNTGPSTAEMIEENIMAMAELAQDHGIKVLLCSVTPVSDYPYLAQQSGRAPAPPPAGGRGGRGMMRQKMTAGRPPADILKLNAWMKDYAQSIHATYVDYFSVLVDDKGWMKDGISNDGLHPNDAGYKLMVPTVSAAIDKALR
jgi:lysophospholipase L1-like esterase